MPCCLRSLTYIALRVRHGLFLVPSAHKGRVPNKWRCFSLPLVFVPRGVYTPKKWLSIFTFIDGFPPSNLIVFCRSPPGICAVGAKKRDDSFHYEEQVSPVEGTSFPLGHSDLMFLLLNETELYSYHSVSNRALRFHFGNSNITEGSILVVLTAFVGGFSIHFTLHPTPMWESDMHTSTVYRQNKSQELQGKHEGIELSLEIFHVSFLPFLMFVFSEVYLSSSVELKKR